MSHRGSNIWAKPCRTLARGIAPSAAPHALSATTGLPRTSRNPVLAGLLQARPERFELPTFGSVDRRSIQLSYGRRSAKSSSRRLQPASPPGKGRATAERAGFERAMPRPAGSALSHCASDWARRGSSSSPNSRHQMVVRRGGLRRCFATGATGLTGSVVVRQRRDTGQQSSASGGGQNE
jgi:hypothetical protein